MPLRSWPNRVLTSRAPTTGAVPGCYASTPGAAGTRPHGGSTRQPIMTAYRQQALLGAAALRAGSARPRDLRAIAPDAAKILLANVYGWFERVERGVYR